MALYDYTPTIVNTGQAFNQGISLGQNERLNDLQQRLANGDKSVVQAITALNPQLASQYTTQQNAVNEQLARGAQAVANAPKNQQASIYKAQRDMAIKNGIPGAESLPQTYDENAQAMIQAQIGQGREAEKAVSQEFEGQQNAANRAVQYSAQQVQKQLGDPFANAMAAMQSAQYTNAQQQAQATPQIQQAQAALANATGQRTGGTGFGLIDEALNLGTVQGADNADAILRTTGGYDDKSLKGMGAKEKIAAAKTIVSQKAAQAANAQNVIASMQPSVSQAISRSAQLGAGATVQPLIHQLSSPSSKFW